MVEGEGWRPPTATSVHLSDHHLAQLGLLASMEAISIAHICMASKGLHGLSLESWKRLERAQFDQVLSRLSDTALAMDAELFGLASDVNNEKTCTDFASPTSSQRFGRLV
ncbi:hypothetical protein [Sphingomonas sp. R86521]|uniref:hypothetical protein n=1 Tax=Sphingomonas sp. R86521 TaxID=3093860 RepID=UPI0036D2A91E